MSETNNTPTPLGDDDVDELASRFRDYELSPEQQERLDHLDDTADDRGGAAELIGDAIIFNWRTMPEEEIAANWSTLAEWVTWLIHRYRLSSSKIPDCWFLHGALVEELSALYSFWVASFRADGSGGGPLGFHRELAAAFVRFRDYNVEACFSQHIEPSERLFIDNRDQFGRWTTETHTYGPDAPPPDWMAPTFR